MGWFFGETSSPRGNFSVTAQASRSFGKCSTPIANNGLLDDVRKAAYGYLALTLDKLLNYNNRTDDAAGSCERPVRASASVFDRHDFAFQVVLCRDGATLVTGARLRLGH